MLEGEYTPLESSAYSMSIFERFYRKTLC